MRTGLEILQEIIERVPGKVVSYAFNSVGFDNGTVYIENRDNIYVSLALAQSWPRYDTSSHFKNIMPGNEGIDLFRIKFPENPPDTDEVRIAQQRINRKRFDRIIND